MLDYKITKEAVSKDIASGNLNPKMLQQFFADMQIRSYSYDYTIQKELVNYHEVRFTTKDLKVDIGRYMFDDIHTERVLYFPIKHQLIATGKRKPYRDSTVYNKALSFEELNANHKLFKYNVLVFLDGKLYTNIRIKPNEEFTHIYFRYRDLAKYLIQPAVDITVYCIPQSVIAVSEPLDNTNSAENFVSFRAFSTTSMKEFSQCSKFYGFLVNQTDGSYIMAESIEYLEQEQVFQIDSVRYPTDISNYKLVLVGSDLIYSVYDLPADNDQFFATELEGMPISTDSMAIMVWDTSRTRWIPNPQSVTITEKYPNVYQVSNPDDYEIRLIVYYADNSQNEHIVYDTEMDYYLDKVNLLDAYQNSYVPAILKDYKPVKWDYNLKTFFNDHNGIHRTNIKEPWTSFQYKMHSISKMIKLWCGFYLEYAKRTYGFLTGWYHDISKWSPEHLASKVRMDSFTDIPPDPTGREEYPSAKFTEPQYVFTYKNDDGFDDANSYLFYIDGKMVIPTKVLVFRGYQYVYLPQKLIKSDSMIEVERFDGVRFSKFLRVPAEGVLVDLSFLKRSIIANSLFIVNKNNEFANDNYKVEVIDPEVGTYRIDLDESVYTLTNKMSLKITPLFDVYNDTQIWLNCNNQLVTFVKRNTGDDYARLGTANVNLNADNQICNVKQKISPRLRIYTKDGRMFSKPSYSVKKRKLYKDKPRFNLPVRPGDEITNLVAYIGYDERLIYHRDVIRNDGFINIEGKTTRPICLAYHDIYLNGVRLHKKDIRIIAPFKFVITTLKKHNTLNNLEIYEKVHADDSMFKFEIDEDSLFLADKLFNEDPVYRKRVLDELETINPDGSIEDLNTIRDWYTDFFERWLFNNYINADIRYDLEYFAPLFDASHGYRVLLNADDRVRYKVAEENRLYLWHDGTIKESGGVNPPVKTDAFADVEGTIPDPNLTLTEREYIDGGLADHGDVKTIYDYDTEIVPEKKVPQYHIPSELDNIPDLASIDTNNTATKVVPEDPDKVVEREHVSEGTRAPLTKINPIGPLEEAPDGVVIEPIVPETIRMPDHISTPEPTLPAEGEYERVEEVLNAVVRLSKTGTTLPGLSAYLVRDSFGRYDKYPIPVGGEEQTTIGMAVRIVFSGTVPKTDVFKNGAVIKVVDQDNKVLYMWDIDKDEVVNIDQVINITTSEFNIVVEPTQLYPVTIAFDDFDVRYLNQITIVNSKNPTKDIVRVTSQNSTYTINIRKDETLQLKIDYSPVRAKDFDRKQGLTADTSSAKFFTRSKNTKETNWYKNEHIVLIDSTQNFFTGAELPSDSNETSDAVLYADSTAFTKMIPTRMRPGNTYHVVTRSLHTWRTGNTYYAGKVTRGSNVNVSGVYKTGIEGLAVSLLSRDGSEIYKCNTNVALNNDFSNLTSTEVTNLIGQLQSGSSLFNAKNIHEDTVGMLGDRIYISPISAANWWKVAFKFTETYDKHTSHYEFSVVEDTGTDNARVLFTTTLKPQAGVRYPKETAITYTGNNPIPRDASNKDVAIIARRVYEVETRKGYIDNRSGYPYRYQYTYTKLNGEVVTTGNINTEVLGSRTDFTFLNLDETKPIIVKAFLADTTLNVLNRTLEKFLAITKKGDPVDYIRLFDAKGRLMPGLQPMTYTFAPGETPIVTMSIANAIPIDVYTDTLSSNDFLDVYTVDASGNKTTDYNLRVEVGNRDIFTTTNNRVLVDVPYTINNLNYGCTLHVNPNVKSELIESCTRTVSIYNTRTTSDRPIENLALNTATFTQTVNSLVNDTVSVKPTNQQLFKAYSTGYSIVFKTNLVELDKITLYFDDMDDRYQSCLHIVDADNTDTILADILPYSTPTSVLVRKGKKVKLLLDATKAKMAETDEERERRGFWGDSIRNLYSYDKATMKTTRSDKFNIFWIDDVRLDLPQYYLEPNTTYTTPGIDDRLHVHYVFPKELGAGPHHIKFKILMFAMNNSYLGAKCYFGCNLNYENAINTGIKNLKIGLVSKTHGQFGIIPVSDISKIESDFRGLSENDVVKSLNAKYTSTTSLLNAKNFNYNTSGLIANIYHVSRPTWNEFDTITFTFTEEYPSGVTGYEFELINKEDDSRPETSIGTLRVRKNSSTTYPKTTTLTFKHSTKIPYDTHIYARKLTT